MSIGDAFFFPSFDFLSKFFLTCHVMVLNSELTLYIWHLLILFSFHIWSSLCNLPFTVNTVYGLKTSFASPANFTSLWIAWCVWAFMFWLLGKGHYRFYCVFFLLTTSLTVHIGSNKMREWKWTPSCFRTRDFLLSEMLWC